MNPVHASKEAAVRFVLKMLAAYTVWYAVYEVWLLPDGRLDAWLSHQVVAAGHEVLAFFGCEAQVNARLLAVAGSPGVYVVNGCNGLSTLGLFGGFVLAFPGEGRRRALFLPFGLTVLYLANVLRVAGLASFQAYWPFGFDVVHRFGSTSVFYGLVFVLWMLWAHYGTASLGAEPSPSIRPDA